MDVINENKQIQKWKNRNSNVLMRIMNRLVGKPQGLCLQENAMG